jgi:hypothetical protein
MVEEELSTRGTICGGFRDHCRETDDGDVGDVGDVGDLPRVSFHL